MRACVCACACAKVFEGLNALGNTRWRINSELFDIINHLWEFGGGEAGLVRRDHTHAPPPPPCHELPEWATPLTEAKQAER